MNAFIEEDARRVPVARTPDVLVVGGGAAGLAAALAAARAGASTLLLERYGFLGGTLSAVTLGTLCGAYLVAGDEHATIVGGLYADRVARLTARGAALPPRLGAAGVGRGVRCDAVEEPRRLAPLPPAGRTGQRPAQREMHTRPCYSDVEQPTFFFHGLAVGAVGQRMRDG